MRGDLRHHAADRKEGIPSAPRAGAVLADVNAVEVVGSESGVALGALPLTRVVPRLDALKAENVEALGQHCVLHPRVAAGTR